MKGLQKTIEKIINKAIDNGWRKEEGIVIVDYINDSDFWIFHIETYDGDEKIDMYTEDVFLEIKDYI